MHPVLVLVRLSVPDLSDPLPVSPSMSAYTVDTLVFEKMKRPAPSDELLEAHERRLLSFNQVHLVRDLTNTGNIQAAQSSTDTLFS